MDKIKASGQGRIVNVSSLGHSWSKGLDFNNLMWKSDYKGDKSYYASKLANVYFTRQTAALLNN